VNLSAGPAFTHDQAAATERFIVGMGRDNQERPRGQEQGPGAPTQDQAKQAEQQ
jgi:hypothetical protein